MSNRFKLIKDGTICQVFFNNGGHFFIDAEDLEKVKKLTWFASKRGYPAAHLPQNKGRSRQICIHRYLLDFPEGYDVDHINGNKLDNRRSNLRICTHQENMFNQRIKSNNSTGFKGVSKNKATGRYEAYVHHSGKKHYLGLFDTPQEAAIARKQAAFTLFGEFANRQAA